MDKIDFTLHFFSPPIQGKLRYLKETGRTTNQIVGMIENQVNNFHWPLYQPSQPFLFHQTALKGVRKIR